VGGHAFLAPSGADQWGPGRCAGSPRLQAAFPGQSGEEALEGNAAHDWAAAAILGNAPPVGAVHQNGQTITPAMAEALEDYVADCQALLARKPDQSGVEVRVRAHQFIHPLCEGTPDFFALFIAERRVYLKDLKFGHGYVGAFRNYQLTVYLIALFETLGLGLPDDSWWIEATIYQPRNYHPSGPIRHWRPKGSELELLRQAFVVAAAESTGPGENLSCTTGDWCRYCTANHACTTLAEDASFSRSHSSKAQIYIQDPDELGRELKANNRALRTLKARNEALDEQAKALVATGVRVRGWTGEWKNGRTTWSVAADRVIAWCKALGADVTKTGTLTPTQALKLGLTEDLIGAITTTPTTFALVEVTSDTMAKGLSENGK